MRVMIEELAETKPTASMRLFIACEVIVGALCSGQGGGKIKANLLICLARLANLRYISRLDPLPNTLPFFFIMNVLRELFQSAAGTERTRKKDHRLASEVLKNTSF